jgi:hypothetical protein
MAKRRTKRTAKRRREQRREAQKSSFLAELRKVGTLSTAVNNTGIGRTTVYEWMREDAAFADDVDKARDEGAGVLEEVLDKCAAKAMSDPRYQTSLIFRLKALKPNKYGESVRHSGPNGGAIHLEGLEISFVKPKKI